MTDIRQYIIEYIGEDDPFKGATYIEFWNSSNREIKMHITAPSRSKTISLDKFLDNKNNVAALANLLVQAKLMHPTQARFPISSLRKELMFVIGDYFGKLKEPEDLAIRKDLLIRFNVER